VYESQSAVVVDILMEWWWRGVRVRVVIRCRKLVDPDHGLIRCDSESLYGSRCELHCRAGFAVVGQPITECLEHARWSHDSALCAGLDTLAFISQRRQKVMKTNGPGRN